MAAPARRAALKTLSPGRNSTGLPLRTNVSAIAASADARGAAPVQHVLLHLVAEVAEEAAHQQPGGGPEAAGGAQAQRLRDLVVAGGRLLTGQRTLRGAHRLVQHLPQADGSDPAGVALAAALALEEAHAVAGEPHSAVAVVEDDDASGAQVDALAGRRGVVQRQIEGGPPQQAP